MSYKPSITSPFDYIDYICSINGIDRLNIPKTCIIVYSDPLVEKIRDEIENTPSNIGSGKQNNIYTFRPKGRREYGVISPLYGDAMAGMTVDELVAMGYRNFFTMGTAGHPTDKDTPDLDKGDILLPTAALNYEGYSIHRLPTLAKWLWFKLLRLLPVPKTDYYLRSLLQEELRLKEIQFKEGIVATTGCLYGEDELFIREVLSRDAVGIDMELSAILTAANHWTRELGEPVRAATMFVISDVIDANEWSQDFLGAEVKRGEGIAFDVASSLVDRL